MVFIHNILSGCPTYDEIYFGHIQVMVDTIHKLGAQLVEAREKSVQWLELNEVTVFSFVRGFLGRF